MGEAKYRKRMCKHCAFRKGSFETSSIERKVEFLTHLRSSHFYCHETMDCTNGKHDSFEGEYNPSNGKEHQVCAGYLITTNCDSQEHFERLSFNKQDIEDHAFVDHNRNFSLDK